MNYRIIAFGLLIFCALAGSAQQHSDTTQIWEITTVEGNTFSGFILDENATDITIKILAYGEMVIKKSLIKSSKIIYSPDGNTKKTKQLPKVIPDENSLWRIVTDDGFDFTGTIVSKNDQKITLKTTKFGTMQILRSSIKSMTIIQQEQIVKGEVWFENPQGSRYFYSPNGYGLKKGEGYYQNVWVLFNQASYGFSDYFTMGVGMIPLFLFGAGLEYTPLWITPKVSFPIIKDVFNVGAGVMAIGIPGEGGLALTYGVATLGDRNSNLNVGLGYAYSSEGEWAKYPTITISGMTRLSKKSYLISENFIVSTSETTTVLAMIGGRTIWPRVSLDYGLVVPISKELNQFIAIPWLGFVIPFGESASAQK